MLTMVVACAEENVAVGVGRGRRDPDPRRAEVGVGCVVDIHEMCTR
jgi:hypothetical protein